MNTKTLKSNVHSSEPARLFLQRAMLDVLNDDSITPDKRYAHFKKRYRNDPVAFAIDCIKWPENASLAPYQSEIAAAVVSDRRVCARSLHGAGKSTLCAIIILWFSLTRDGQDWKVVTTASAWRQLTKYLWPEVHKWARLLDWEKIGRKPFSPDSELFSLSLKLQTGEAFAVASNRPEYIEGAHARHLLYVFDESKVIPDGVWDSVEGAFAAEGETYWLSVSTPGAPIGRFYDIQSHHPGYVDWRVFHIRLQDAIDAGRVSAAWANDRRRQWGARSARYRNRVLGEFSQEDANVIIPLDWIEAAVERGRSLADNDAYPPYALRIAADIARFGTAKSVIARSFDKIVFPLDKREQLDTMEIAGLLAQQLHADPHLKATVDIIGLGAGTYDRLSEQFPGRIYGFVASAHTDYTPNMDLDGDGRNRLYFNHKRSAAWWYMRELLDPANGHNLALPDDDELVGDLSAPTYKTISNGRIAVEQKEMIAKRIGRSTDCGDAVVMVMWDEEMDYGVDCA